MLLDKINPSHGLAPSLPYVKLCRILKPVPSVLTANTVPAPELPAAAAVPYKVLFDKINPAFGLAPSKLIAGCAVSWPTGIKPKPATSADSAHLAGTTPGIGLPLPFRRGYLFSGARTFLSAAASRLQYGLDSLPPFRVSRCCGQECPRSALNTYRRGEGRGEGSVCSLLLAPAKCARAGTRNKLIMLVFIV